MKSPHFIESICFEKGKYGLLDLHQKRVDLAFARHFPGHRPHDLSRILPQLDFEEKYKVRVVYSAEQVDLEYAEYFPRIIKHIKLIDDDKISYTHKYEDRSQLTRLFNKKDSADEILIIKKGMVTDSYYANVVFRKGTNWFTPSTYLLNGVRRQHLLKEGLIQEREIRKSDLLSFEEVSLINALNDLGEIRVPIDRFI